MNGGRRLLILVGLVAVYAPCFAAIKAGIAYAPPLLFGGLRAAIAGVALFAVAAASRRPLLLDRRGWYWLPALALTGTTIAFGVMFAAPGRTDAGIASVLGNTQPLFALALAAVFLAEPLTRVKLAALALGLGGVTLVSSGALAGPGAYGVSGPLLALAASASVAANSVIVKRMGTRPDVLALTAWQLLFGGAPLLAGFAAFERGATVDWSGTFLALLLFLALAGTALAIPVWYWLVQREEVGRLTLFLFLVPVAGLALAAALFGERVSLIEGSGVVLTLGGIGVVARKTRRSRAAPAPPRGDGRLLSEPSSVPQPGLSEVRDAVRGGEVRPRQT